MTGGTSGDRPLVAGFDIRKEFSGRGRRDRITAVDGVTIHIRAGESLGVVGESGSGKTTLARCLILLTSPTSGSIVFEDRELTGLTRGELRPFRRRFQMVFQDPYDSLNPRWTVERSIEEPLLIDAGLTPPDRRERVSELLGLVQLDDRFRRRYPHQLSGGQQQRVGIARALATNPKLLVLDEPTSALDALVRVEILRLLNDLRAELGLTYLYISHDLGSVRTVCDRISVMYLGRIVEEAPTEAIFSDPQHPYTRTLMSSVLAADLDTGRARVKLAGEAPSPSALPPGCHLHPRCPIAIQRCASVEQDLEEVAKHHRVACMRLSGSDVVDWPPGWDNASLSA